MNEKKIISQVENPELVEKRHMQIIRAAGELFSKKGYHPTSMRDISKASGINLSYLYKYISSKDDILYLYYNYLHKQWEHIFKALSKSEKNPVKQIKDFISSILETVHRFNDEIRTMYTESRHLEKDSLKAVLSKESEMIKQLEGLIVRGTEQGFFHTEDPFMSANIIQYMVCIAPLRGWSFNDRYTFTRFVELLTDAILNMLKVKEKDKP